MKPKQQPAIYICEYCHNEFERLPGTNDAHRFCSRKCSGIARPKKGMKICICEWCKKEFETWPSRPGRFCSDQCRSEFGARQPKYVNRKPETMKIERICEVCEKHFYTSKYQIELRQGGGRYCSISCRGSNWDSQKRKALKRDDYSCQICGHRRQIISITKNRIDVHHIKPYVLFDGDFEAANQLSNLITLCHTHHIQVENGKIGCPQPKS